MNRRILLAGLAICSLAGAPYLFSAEAQHDDEKTVIAAKDKDTQESDSSETPRKKRIVRVQKPGGGEGAAMREIDEDTAVRVRPKKRPIPAEDREEIEIELRENRGGRMETVRRVPRPGRVPPPTMGPIPPELNEEIRNEIRRSTEEARKHLQEAARHLREAQRAGMTARFQRERARVHALQGAHAMELQREMEAEREALEREIQELRREIERLRRERAAQSRAEDEE